MGDGKGGKGGGDEKEEEKKNDDYNQNNNGRRHRVRLSLSIGMNNPFDAESLDQNGNRLSRHRPLSRRCFHNDGLNAAICSNSQSRHVIHRRDNRFPFWSNDSASKGLLIPILRLSRTLC